MAKFLLLFIISMYVFREGCCQTFCNVCECVPTNANPQVVRCTGSENLTRFPENISNSVVSLYVLNLPITQLETKDLMGLTSLTDLFILNNKQLSTIQAGSFQDLSNLQRISLSNNSLSTLTTSSLTGLQNLKEINMEHNMITALPDNICSVLPSLETFEMTFNSLQTVGSDIFKGCSEIVYVDLSNNEITTIAEDAFQNLTSLSRLQINGNKLTTFHSMWIADKSSSSFNLVIDSSTFTCTEQLKTEYDAMLKSHPEIIGCNKTEKFCPKCQNFGGKALLNVTMQDFNPVTIKPETTATATATTKSHQTEETMKPNTATQNNITKGTFATANATKPEQVNTGTSKIYNGTTIEATTLHASQGNTSETSHMTTTSGALHLHWSTGLIILGVPVVMMMITLFLQD